MKINRPFYRLSTIHYNVISLLICLFSIPMIYAQKPQVYEGEYLLSGEMEGKAVYNYITENGIQIKEGPFQFTRFTEEEDYLEKYQLKGDFQADKKTGKWIFTYHSLRPQEEETIVDFAIHKTASGVVYKVESNFEKGKLHGTAVVLELKIENSKVVDTLKFVRAKFNNGNFVGEIQLENAEHQLKGEVNANAFLTGEWVLTHTISGQKPVETRTYNSGILTSNHVEFKGKRYNLNHFVDQNTNANLLYDISLDETYNSILAQSTNGGRIYEDELKDSQIEKIQNASNSIFLEVFEQFRTFNDVKIWDKDVEVQLPKVKVRKYPYTKEERQMIEKSAKLDEETNDLLLDFLNDTQVKISLNTNDSIAKYHAVFKAYKSAFLNLKVVFDELRKPAFEFVDRSKVIPRIFNGVRYPDEIQFSSDNTKKSMPFHFPKHINDEQSDISILYAQLVEINKDLQQYRKVIEPILSQEKQREDLVEDEALLVEKRDSIFKVFNPENELNVYQSLVATKVISYVDESFSSYARKPINERVATLSSTLACFDHFLELNLLLEAMPQKIEEIKTLYTRTVWNPFTMTDMDEIVKEDVYQAYREILLDHYLTILESRINCLGLESAMDNFDELFNKMITLREQDTQKLEKKVKRESDPETLIEAFELNKIKGE